MSLIEHCGSPNGNPQSSPEAGTSRGGLCPAGLSECSINQTPEQARLRVLEARTGSLVDATDEHLSALRNEVQAWLYEIDRVIALRIAAERADVEEQEDQP